MFAAPIPIISWLPSTSCPVRAANDDAVEMVSASETSAMPSAPATSGPRSDSSTVRERERREALRQHADQRDAVVGQVEDAGGARSTARPRRAPPGTFGSQRCSTRIEHDRRRCPIAAAAGDRLAVGQPAHERPCLVDQPVGVDARSRTASAAGRPGSSAPGRSCSRSCVGFDSRSATKPSRASPATIMIDADHQREHRRQRDRPLRDRRPRRRAAGSSPRSSGRARSPGRARGSATGRRRRTPSRQRIDV